MHTLLAMTLSMGSICHHIYYFTLLFPYFSSCGFVIYRFGPTPKTLKQRLDSQAFIQRPTSTSTTSLHFTNTALLSPGIELIDEKNEELYDMLQRLRDEPYFKLYSVDMLGSCEYMPQQLFECSSETCEIYPVDDEEVHNWNEMHRFCSFSRLGPYSY